MSEPDKNASDPELRARLSSLKSALGRAEGDAKPGSTRAGQDGALAGAMSSAMEMSAMSFERVSRE